MTPSVSILGSVIFAVYRLPVGLSRCLSTPQLDCSLVLAIPITQLTLVTPTLREKHRLKAVKSLIQLMLQIQAESTFLTYRSIVKLWHEACWLQKILYFSEALNVSPPKSPEPITTTTTTTTMFDESFEIQTYGNM